MKAISNFIKRIGKSFNRTKEAVKQQIATSNEQTVTRRVTPQPRMILCGGNPMPQRLLNQRQRRKLSRRNS